MDSNYGGKLPRPDQILIYNFAVSPDEVELDSGISGDIQQLINQTPRTDQERAIGRSVSDALANHLVKDVVDRIDVAGTNTRKLGAALAGAEDLRFAVVQYVVVDIVKS